MTGNYITGMYKNTNYRRFTRYDTGRYSRAGKESRELIKENVSGGFATKSLSFYQVPILGLATLSLRTLISSRKFLIHRALGSGHTDPGLSECNPAST